MPVYDFVQLFQASRRIIFVTYSLIGAPIKYTEKQKKVKCVSLSFVFVHPWHWVPVKMASVKIKCLCDRPVW